MKAIVIHAPHDIRLHDWPTQTPVRGGHCPNRRRRNLRLGPALLPPWSFLNSTDPAPDGFGPRDRWHGRGDRGPA
jgi:hypothetical protein